LRPSWMPRDSRRANILLLSGARDIATQTTNSSRVKLEAFSSCFRHGEKVIAGEGRKRVWGETWCCGFSKTMLLCFSTELNVQRWRSVYELSYEACIF
jgi:hypothetical protein